MSVSFLSGELADRHDVNPCKQDDTESETHDRSTAVEEWWWGRGGGGAAVGEQRWGSSLQGGAGWHDVNV